MHDETLTEAPKSRFQRISNWLLGAWISVCSLLQIWPESMLYVWGIMPDDLIELREAVT